MAATGEAIKRQICRLKYRPAQRRSSTYPSALCEAPAKSPTTARQSLLSRPSYARRWPLPGLLGGLLIGALVLFPTLLAFIQLRQLGAWTLVVILALVWAADVAAYFSGRTFGKRKLAPNISPGKTWAGAWGAVVGVLAYGFLAQAWLPAALRPNAAVFAVVLVLLTVLSIVGDLFESLLKRQAGLKDSSNVLPGHGGVLDRIDSQTSTLPLVALLWLSSAV